MGRIAAQTKVADLFDESKSIECGMLADTGASALILPSAWKGAAGRISPFRAAGTEIGQWRQVAGLRFGGGKACRI